MEITELSEEEKGVHLIILARTSDRSQSNFSIASQIEEGKGHANQLKATYEVIRENGVSSQYVPRPNLEKILAKARRGKLDYLFVVHISRIARNVKWGFPFIVELLANDVTIITLSKKYEPDDHTSLILALMDMHAAEDQYKSITVGSKEGTLKAIRDGYWPQGNRPWGYNLIKGSKRNKIEKLPGFEPIFNDLLDSFIDKFQNKSENDTLVSFVNEFNSKYSKKLEKLGETKLTVNKLKNVLSSLKYIGILEHKEEPVTDRKDLALTDKNKFYMAKDILNRNFTSPKGKGKGKEKKDKILLDLINDFGIDFIKNYTNLQLKCFDEKCPGIIVEIGNPKYNKSKGTAQQIYECRECGKRFDFPSGKLRRDIENGKPISCPICDITEQFEIEENSTQDGLTKFKCKVCGFIFFAKIRKNIYLRKVNFDKQKKETQEAKEGKRESVLKLISDLHKGGGVKYNELYEKVGLDEDTLDDTLGRLLLEGEIYEPKLEHFKAIP